MKEMEKILFRIKKGEDLEKIFKEEKWQNFEEFVAYILEEHGFKTKTRARFKKGKYEIDVLAEMEDFILAIECKKWRGRSQNRAKLKSAAEKHTEKCEIISELMKKKVIPVIVTLIDSGIEKESGVKESGVIFVPAFKFNYFLLNLYQFI